jgi:16S rRNA (uracil1498-N3)-methyltransferase
MPRAPRFFISPDQVTGADIVISGEDVRHIATVLRMRNGDELLLSDGQGTEYSVTITSVDRTAVATRVLSRESRSLRFPRITLCQGIPKSDKMDLIMQKATELGVASIIPLVTERTIVKLKDEEKRIGRWQKICREAAMQSNRPDIPRVEQVRKFPALLSGLPNPPLPSEKEAGLTGDREPLLLFPWEEGTAPVKDVLRSKPRPKNVFVIIGPEGGLSEKEAGMAREKGFHLVSLGRTILRTETAALAVLSMLEYEFMS